MEWKWVIYLIIIVMAIAIYKQGFDAWKSNPIKQSIDSGIDTTKSIIDYGKDIIGKDKEETNLGMIPCSNNESCNVFEECDNNCICNIQTGECKK